MTSIIQFRIPTGEVRKVDAADGETVMRAALSQDIPGIVGECGGELTCATCHVHVTPEWFDQLEPASGDEEDMLEVLDDRTEHSRLCCQIRITPDLDGIEVAVPEH
ncbi:2Fe-2S iron-sulfur cluster-binding protein [Paenarthrobacter sp. RAF54_2]|uniref:2Fe-2S iron-sulfur cluster-binding protein n=1 Tax=Micrococcaceae TaxID=1268 RepID=UPI0008B677B2|nr:2Fe-2S iron-sulfur cluster-binding protein [Arthrobacter sp. OV608]SEQ26145.1 ferredoxin, 2Fe-2S [Arthrobacter sp. OV608]